MQSNTYTITSELFPYPGMASWHFVAIPKKESALIKESFEKQAKGWGSIPVQVCIGTTQWQTSLFPDKKSGTYILPVKASVRKQEEVYDGDIISLTITIMVHSSHE